MKVARSQRMTAFRPDSWTLSISRPFTFNWSDLRFQSVGQFARERPLLSWCLVLLAPAANVCFPPSRPKPLHLDVQKNMPYFLTWS